MPSIADVYTTVFPETSRIASGIRTAFREVDADAREAGGRWGREIEQGIGKPKVELQADTAKATAEIDVAAKDRHSTIHVDVDRSQFSQLGSQMAPAAAQAGIQAGSAMGGSMRTELIAAGVAAIAAIASSASGLAGLIPAAIGGAGLGIGTLVVGLDGVKDAWDAVGKAAKDSGKDQAAQSKEVASATRSLNAAVKDEALAQKDVANARKDAMHQLRDLNLELRGGALDEKQAQLDLLQAQNDLATGTFKNSIEYEQAQLRVLQAQQRVDESHQRGIDMQEKANDALAKGVDGADGVVAANNRLSDAQDRVAQAQQSLDTANNKVSASAQDAAEKMALLSPAGQELITTLQGMMPQFQAFKFAIQDALLTGLGPQIQQLATTYLPLLQGAMGSMATTMNRAFGSLAQLFQTPEMLASMQSILNNISGSFATWSQSLVPLAQAFTKLTEVGSSFLPQLADGAVQAAQSFAQFINEAANSGQLQQWIQTGITTMTQLGGIIQQLGPIFLALAPIGTAVLTGIQTILASLAPSIGPLSTAFASLITAITPILGVIGQLVSVVITSVAPALTMWLNTLAPVIQQMAGLFQPVLEALAPVLQQVAGSLANSMVQGIQTLLPVLVPFVQQMGQLLIAVMPLLPQLVNLAISALPVVQQALALVLPLMTRWAEWLTRLATIVIPPLTKVVETMGKMFGTQFNAVKDVVSTVWDFVKPILDAMKAALDAVAQPLSVIGNLFGGGPADEATAKLNAARAQVGLPPLAPTAAGGSTIAKVSPGVAPPGTYSVPVAGGGLGNSAWQPSGGGWSPAPSSFAPAPTNATPFSSQAQSAGSVLVTPQGLQAALSVAQGASGRQYGYGGVGGAGNAGLYDCSGFMSDIYAAMTGKPYTGSERYFTTESDFSKLGFLPTTTPVPGAFNIGVHNGGGGKNSHMAGTLPNGVNVESGGNGTLYGGKAAGAFDPQFENHYYLPTSGAGPMAGTPGMPVGSPTDPMYIALSPNIPAGQRAGDKNSGGQQLGQDITSGLLEIFGLGDIFPDPTQFGLFKILKGFLGLKPKDGGGAGSDGSLFPGGGGGGGGGGLVDTLTGFIPKPFGDLSIGSPKDAPGQFMPAPGQGGGGGGGAVLPNPFAAPNDPSRVAGPGNYAPQQPGVNIDMSNSSYGYSPGAVTDSVLHGATVATRQPLRSLPS